MSFVVYLKLFIYYFEVEYKLFCIQHIRAKHREKKIISIDTNTKMLFLEHKAIIIQLTNTSYL